MRLAYRLVDTYTDRFGTDETQDPFVPRHRAFSQWGYESRLGEGGDQWRADLTIQWIGEQRLPSTASNSEPNQRPDMAEDFTQVNFQVTRQFNEAWSLYGGVENLMNVRQDRPIISADNPQGSEFDASIVYGPIFGRMIYGGLRWALARPE
jgi:outer membrane receptor protein involved in Fe transport